MFQPRHLPGKSMKILCYDRRCPCRDSGSVPRLFRCRYSKPFELSPRRLGFDHNHFICDFRWHCKLNVTDFRSRGIRREAWTASRYSRTAGLWGIQLCEKGNSSNQLNRLSTFREDSVLWSCVGASWVPSFCPASSHYTTLDMYALSLCHALGL
jgi:hypothetical protein